MAEANGICDLPKQGIQSILEGFSIDDSERSLPQVPNETLGLSSVSQTLSSSFTKPRLELYTNKTIIMQNYLDA